MRWPCVGLVFALLSILGLVGCASNFNVGGAVHGLDSGEFLMLQNNGKDDLLVDCDGSFMFAEQVEDGDGYDVSVKTLPGQKYCTVSRAGSGMISGGDVLDVEIACWERWNWDGTVWLAAGQSNIEIEDSFAEVEGPVDVLTYSGFKGPEHMIHEWMPIYEAPGFSAVGGSFALELADILDEPVHVLAVAESSTPISCWLVTGECFDKNVRQFVGQRFDGVIWWQGETEAMQLFDLLPDGYGEQLRSLVAQWREYFGDPDLPFLIVELQHYQESPETSEPSSWEIVRAAQYRIAEKVPNVFLVGSVDLTPEGCLHPTHVYQRIGSRLALMAETFLSQ